MSGAIGTSAAHIVSCGDARFGVTLNDHRGLLAEPDLGALLPCNVGVRQQDGAALVAAMEPLTALGMIDNAALDEVAQEAHARLARVISSLG